MGQIPDDDLDTAVSSPLETISPAADHSPAMVSAASEYRRVFGRGLMVLIELRGEVPHHCPGHDHAESLGHCEIP